MDAFSHKPDGFPVHPYLLLQRTDFRGEVATLIEKNKSIHWRKQARAGGCSKKRDATLRKAASSLKALIKGAVFDGRVPQALAVILMACCEEELSAQKHKGSGRTTKAEGDLLMNLANLYMKYTGLGIGYSERGYFCQIAQSVLKDSGFTLSLSGTKELIRNTVTLTFRKDIVPVPAERPVSVKVSPRKSRPSPKDLPIPAAALTLVDFEDEEDRPPPRFPNPLSTEIIMLSYEQIKDRGGLSAMKKAGYEVGLALMRWKEPARVYAMGSARQKAAYDLLFAGSTSNPDILLSPDAVHQFRNLFFNLSIS